MKCVTKYERTVTRTFWFLLRDCFDIISKQSLSQRECFGNNASNFYDSTRTLLQWRCLAGLEIWSRNKEAKIQGPVYYREIISVHCQRSKKWFTWHVISIIFENKPHAHHKTRLNTMKVYNTRPVNVLPFAN